MDLSHLFVSWGTRLSTSRYICPRILSPVRRLASDNRKSEYLSFHNQMPPTSPLRSARLLASEALDAPAHLLYTCLSNIHLHFAPLRQETTHRPRFLLPPPWF